VVRDQVGHYPRVCICVFTDSRCTDRASTKACLYRWIFSVGSPRCKVYKRPCLGVSDERTASQTSFQGISLYDLDEGNIDALAVQVRSNTQGPYNPDSTFFYNDDSNRVLLSDVFPRVKYEEYARGLCLLDPYGLHLDWKVIKTAGQMRSIEIFVNFPIMDINRNVLRRNPTATSASQADRLTRYWGDESWRTVAYSTTGNLFGYEEKTSNEALPNAFRERLKTVAGFEYVPQPMPMKNSKGAVVYYLYFASHKPVASRIVRDIFKKYQN
jgi:three-Cys-motif partner protein